MSLSKKTKVKAVVIALLTALIAVSLIATGSGEPGTAKRAVQGSTR